MTLEKRKEVFHKLREYLVHQKEEELFQWSILAKNHNPWFDEKSVKYALSGLIHLLEENEIEVWLKNYAVKDEVESKKVGVVMAGNIPLVGIHDLICVILSGHKLHAKLSKSDEILMKKIIEKLLEIEPKLSDKIIIKDQLKDVDAYIATGSDNTSRYFEYYFSKKPNIIRKNRTSCAILNGNEKEEDLKKLSKDIYTYYGLGCRNISKVFISENFELNSLLEVLEEEGREIILHYKYANNYDYQKSIALVNGEKFFDTGNILLLESSQIVSPISVLYYEYYKDQRDLDEKLQKHKHKLQCIVSSNSWLDNSINFGEAQSPKINDYADDVDTMKFLLSL